MTYTTADVAWESWVGEVYQLAGAVLLAGDHYTPESLEALETLLLDALADPLLYDAEGLHAEWKRRAVLSEQPSRPTHADGSECFHPSGTENDA